MLIKLTSKLSIMKNLLASAMVFMISFQLLAQARKQQATLIFKNGTELNCLARISGENIRYVENERKGVEIIVDEKDLLGIKIWMRENLVELYYKTEEGKKHKPKLMELINKGKMKLYRISDVYQQNIGFSSNDNYFKGKSASTVYFLESKTNKDEVFRMGYDFDQVAKAYFADCPALIENIGKDEFRKKDLFKMVIFYNENCGK